MYLPLIILSTYLILVNSAYIHQSCSSSARTKLDVAVEEAGKIAAEAREYMYDARDQEGSIFDQRRTWMSFATYQGGSTSGEQQDRWSTVFDNFKKVRDFVENRHTHRMPWIVCGDSHLDKFYVDEDGNRYSARSQARGRIVGFQYYDTLGKDWWPFNEGVCRDNPDMTMVTDMKLGYILVCSRAFGPQYNEPRKITIGSTDRKKDYTLAANRDANPLVAHIDYWTQALSYIMLHELTHLIFGYLDQPLPRVIQWLLGETKLAYKFEGATLLLRRRDHLVPTNVDNFALIGLSLYMKGCDWSTGYARSETEVLRLA